MTLIILNVNVNKKSGSGECVGVLGGQGFWEFCSFFFCAKLYNQLYIKLESDTFFSLLNDKTS